MAKMNMFFRDGRVDNAAKTHAIQHGDGGNDDARERGRKGI